jgi:hypothetical protein
MWLRFSELLAPLEVHHHDVVHFALSEVIHEIDEGNERELAEKLRIHIQSKSVPPKPPELCE